MSKEISLSNQEQFNRFERGIGINDNEVEIKFYDLKTKEAEVMVKKYQVLMGKGDVSCTCHDFKYRSTIRVHKDDGSYEDKPNPDYGGCKHIMKAKIYLQKYGDKWVIQNRKI